MAPLHNFLALVVLALSLTVFSSALPYKDSPPKSVCKHPLKRKEWRTLKDDEKKDYIEAVLCLQRLPSKSTISPGAVTRWDDFVTIHITHSKGFIEKNGGIHFVGQFMPWHRYLLVVYENALREECGYKGAHPYWDWTLDTGPGKDFRDSPLFDPVTGFGGNGDPSAPPPPPSLSRFPAPGGTGGGCVLDGPFVNLTLNLGPGESLEHNPHCLTRSLNPSLANTYLSYYPNISPLENTTTFEEVDIVLEGTTHSLDEPIGRNPHGRLHQSLGGLDADLYSSINEPLFYVHHAFIDALWLRWQLEDPTGFRFSDVGGTSKPFTRGPEVTLDFLIDLGEFGAPIPISRVMNILKGNKGGIGCYEYEW